MRTCRVHTEKVDEHGFLIGVEVSADHQRLVVGAVGVERDLLCAFRRFEAARMTLGLRSFSSKGLELLGEFRRSSRQLLHTRRTRRRTRMHAHRRS
jgi:hypothetical protein